VCQGRAAGTGTEFFSRGPGGGSTPAGGDLAPPAAANSSGAHAREPRRPRGEHRSTTPKGFGPARGSGPSAAGTAGGIGELPSGIVAGVAGPPRTGCPANQGRTRGCSRRMGGTGPERGRPRWGTRRPDGPRPKKRRARKNSGSGGQLGPRWLPARRTRPSRYGGAWGSLRAAAVFGAGGSALLKASGNGDPPRRRGRRVQRSGRRRAEHEAAWRGFSPPPPGGGQAQRRWKEPAPGVPGASEETRFARAAGRWPDPAAVHSGSAHRESDSAVLGIGRRGLVAGPLPASIAVAPQEKGRASAQWGTARRPGDTRPAGLPVRRGPWHGSWAEGNAGRGCRDMGLVAGALTGPRIPPRGRGAGAGGMVIRGAVRPAGAYEHPARRRPRFNCVLPSFGMRRVHRGDGHAPLSSRKGPGPGGTPIAHGRR